MFLAGFTSPSQSVSDALIASPPIACTTGLTFVTCILCTTRAVCQVRINVAPVRVSRDPPVVMSAWTPKYTEEQRRAVEHAYCDVRIRPVTKIVRMAAAGELRSERDA